MAANIEFNENNQSYSFIESIRAGKRAWHGLGTVYDSPLTVEEALKGANADFKVTKQPIIAITPEVQLLMDMGEPIAPQMLMEGLINGSKATMRDDNNAPLGIVSDAYSVINNIEGFRFIDNLCTGGSGAPCIECAGVLTEGGCNVGSRVFVTAKFPEQIRLNHRESDLVDMYIVFSTSHTGKGSLSVLVSPTRVVCANTLNAAFRDAQSRWNVRHTSHANDRMANIEEATRTLKLYDIYKTEFQAKMDMMAKVKMSDADIKHAVARLVSDDDKYAAYVKNGYSFEGDEFSTRLRNRYDSLYSTIFTGVGQELTEEGTGLHFYNGVTCWLDNVVANKDEEKHFVSLMAENGSANKKQQMAFDLVMDMAA